MLWSYRKMWWHGVYDKGQSGASPGWHWGVYRLSHLLNSLPADTIQYHAIQRSPRCQRKALRNTSDLNASHMLSDQNKKRALTPLVHNLASGKYSQPTGLQELSMNGNRGVLRQGCNEGMALRHSRLQLVHLVRTHTNTHVIPSPVLKRGNPTSGNQLGKTRHYGLIGDFLVAWETGCHGVSHHYHEGRRKRFIFPLDLKTFFYPNLNCLYQHHPCPFHHHLCYCYRASWHLLFHHLNNVKSLAGLCITVSAWMQTKLSQTEWEEIFFSRLVTTSTHTSKQKLMRCN